MATLVKASQKFSLCNGSEVAMCGTYWLHPTDDMSVLINNWSSLQAAFWNTIKGKWDNSTSWVETLFQEIDVDTGNVITADSLAGPGAGSSGGVPLPPQCAEVITVRTGVSGGRNRGRFYLPAFRTDESNDDGRIVTATRDLVLGTYATFFSDINTAIGWEIGVYSRENRAWTVATTIDMGNVFDTQRGRRASMVEARTSAAVN